MAVTDTDRGFKALQKRLHSLAHDDWSVTVGVHDAHGSKPNRAQLKKATQKATKFAASTARGLAKNTRIKKSALFLGKASKRKTGVFRWVRPLIGIARNAAKYFAKRQRSGMIHNARLMAKQAAKAQAITVAEIALIHEFGAPAANIPPRSFIGAWFDEHSTDLYRQSSSDIASFLKGTLTRQKVLSRAGARAVGGIQSRISQGIPPPLKPGTIKKKGSSVPLIDTGQLRTSITFKISKAKGQGRH